MHQWMLPVMKYFLGMIVLASWGPLGLQYSANHS